MALSYKVAFSYQQNTSTTNVATSGFSQVIAASSVGNSASGKLQYANSTGQVLQLGYTPQASASNVTAYLSIPPTVVPVVIECYLPNNNNICLKAISANATSGWVTLDILI